jgi:hypothetical protein
MRYVEIDSTYRNRTQFPNPADYQVLTGHPTSGCGQVINSTSALQPTTLQATTFPPTSINPITFFEDEDTKEVLERAYTPYMFRASEEDPTIIRIDELPVAPLTPNTLTVSESITLERNVYAHPEADNVYIGKQLEYINTSTGTSEFRTIISTTYDTNVVTLHCGRIDSVVGTQVTFSCVLYNNPKPSDIDRFYVGKTLTVNGQNRLILNYTYNTISNLGVATVESEFTDISVNDKFCITTNKSWIVQVDSPYTQTLPTYPASTQQTTQVNVIHEVVQANPNTVSVSNIIRHTDNTYGIAYGGSSGVFYMTSADTDGRLWTNTPVTIDATGLQGTRLELFLVDGQPAVAYRDKTDEGVDLYQYNRATSVNGSTWGTVNNLPVDFWVISFYLSRLLFITTDATNLIMYQTADLTGAGGWDSSQVLSKGYGGAIAENVTFLDLLYKDDTTADLKRVTIGPGGPGIFFPPGPTFDVVLNTTVNVDWDTNHDPKAVYQPLNDAKTIHSIAVVDTSGVLYAQSSSGSTLNKPPFDVDAMVQAAEAVNTSFAHVLSLVNSPNAMSSINYIYIDTNGVINIVTSTDLSSLSWLTPETLYPGTGITSLNSYFDPNIDDLQVTFNSNSTLVNVLYSQAVLSEVPAPYSIRSEAPFEQSSRLSNGIVPAGSSVLQVQLVGASPVDTYTGKYISLKTGIQIPNTSTPSTPFTMINDIRLITAYDPSTGVVDVSPALSVDLSGLTSPYTVNWEILSFTTDSYNALVNLSQTTTYPTQSLCYEVSIASLILPNLTLSTGTGNRIAFYPYVYVEISGTDYSRSSNLIISNNPHATRAVFRVPIYNVNTPDRASFVVLDGRGMRQTIKLNLQLGFHFRVLLPNGDIFTTQQSDTSVPLPPDANVQTSAMFALKLIE